MGIKAWRKPADTYTGSSAIDLYLLPQIGDLGIHDDGSRSTLRYVRCIAILQAMLSHSLRFGLVKCSGSSNSVQTQPEAVYRHTSRLLGVPSCWNKFGIRPDNVEDFSLQSSLTTKLRRMLALAALSATKRVKSLCEDITAPPDTNDCQQRLHMVHASNKSRTSRDLLEKPNSNAHPTLICG